MRVLTQEELNNISGGDVGHSISNIYHGMATSTPRVSGSNRGFAFVGHKALGESANEASFSSNAIVESLFF